MKIHKSFETKDSRFVLRLDDFSSTLPEEYLSVLDDVVIYDVALHNEGIHKTNKKTDIIAFKEICSYLLSFLKDNPRTIFYFYCDDRNQPPKLRRNVSMQRFRSELFHCFYVRYVTDKKQIKEHIIRIDDREVYDKEIFIHLIYSSIVEDKAIGLKNIISEQASK